MVRRGILCIACTTITIPYPALAQSNTAQTIIQLLRSAAEKGQSRRAGPALQAQQNAPELSLPLQYKSASGPINPANRSDPRNLDVAGVRLGMIQAEAERALRGAGYVDSGIESDQASYQHDIQVEWSKQNDTPYPKTVLIPKDRQWQRGKQRVSVTFLALPDGPAVNEVAYTAEDANLTPAGFTDQVRARYGPPSNEDASDMRWCTVKAPECEDPRSAEYPILAAWADNRSIFLIGNDPARAEALEARRAADIASRKPPEPEAAF